MLPKILQTITAPIRRATPSRASHPFGDVTFSSWSNCSGVESFSRASLRNIPFDLSFLWHVPTYMSRIRRLSRVEVDSVGPNGPLHDVQSRADGRLRAEN